MNDQIKESEYITNRQNQWIPNHPSSILYLLNNYLLLLDSNTLLIRLYGEVQPYHGPESYFSCLSFSHLLQILRLKSLNLSKQLLYFCSVPFYPLGRSIVQVFEVSCLLDYLLYCHFENNILHFLKLHLLCFQFLSVLETHLLQFIQVVTLIFLGTRFEQKRKGLRFIRFFCQYLRVLSQKFSHAFSDWIHVSFQRIPNQGKYLSLDCSYLFLKRIDRTQGKVNQTEQRIESVFVYHSMLRDETMLICP